MQIMGISIIVQFEREWYAVCMWRFGKETGKEKFKGKEKGQRRGTINHMSKRKGGRRKTKQERTVEYSKQDEVTTAGEDP
jgi:hypothetical protein